MVADSHPIAATRNLLGVMQGRLLPKYKGRYQAHPVGFWEKEFAKASELGLDFIEFILDFEDADKNPLLNERGIEDITRISAQTGVVIRTVCADYFMEAPLHHPDTVIASRSQGVLRRLLDLGQRLGLTDVVIPCVDQSSMRDTSAMDRFVRSLIPLLETAERAKTNLSLETDFAPQPFAELLAQFESSRVTVNYDTGNSASLGYDPAEELKCYGNRISDVHLKDRVRNGGSVPLGTGDTLFDRFFSALRRQHYTGPFVLQPYRDDDGLEIFRAQLEWVRPYLAPWFSKTRQ